MSTKVSVYIDGANLFHGAELIGVRVDYQKLKNILVSNRTLADLNFYNCDSKKLGERSFHNKLQSLGYCLKLVPLHTYGGKSHEKKVDTQIVADSLIDGLIDNKFDVAIFGSGDKDILPAVEYLIQRHKQVEITSFQHTLAWELKKSGAKIIDLTAIKSLIKRN